MKQLNLEQLLQIHALVIKSTGGSAGLRDLGRLESTIASQTQYVFGQELYEGLFVKAAAIIRGIIADHPFIDGNKRTGMLSGVTFLAINNVRFKGAEGTIEDYAVKIATEHLSIEEIANWLKQNCK